jgi:hypothetical protein
MKQNKKIKHLLLLAIVTVSCTYGKSFDKALLNANSETKIKIRNQPSLKNQKKAWTFIVYAAGDNNLGPFLIKNIQQMALIGSNQHINIVVHVDMRATGNKKISRRYYVEKNKLTQIDNIQAPYMDSGDPETLISCCKWAIQDYPADNFMLVLSNHGTGPIDPPSGKVINPSELFFFNPLINKLELDRSIGFLDLMATPTERERRGICWDDTTGNYLTNQKLDAALNTICREYLDNKKFSIIGFDACLMSTIEIANIIKKYADIMVSSQEVELGNGWYYNRVLSPFQDGPLDKKTFATHIVNEYNGAYAKLTNDYTLSALDLNKIHELEFNIHDVSALLIECLKNQIGNSVKNTIKLCGSQSLCTHFDEPSYKDLDHFYSNLLDNLRKFNLSTPEQTRETISHLKALLEDGRALIQEIAIANAVGKNLRNAKGITIYLPKDRIHPSYRKTTFAENNHWMYLLSLLTQA